MVSAVRGRALIRVTGTVQGVGFRPFVHREAVARGLVGTVCNDSRGVLIDVEGPAAELESLEAVLSSQPPPLATVATVEVVDHGTATERVDFRIVDSPAGGRPAAPVSVDRATCPDCRAELFDRSDRRYRYPFTNCTNCGPRYTIVRHVPYDRRFTTMAPFAMCAECQAEYDDPSDRRFHAQPTACPACGPTLLLLSPGGEELARGDAALTRVTRALLDKRIVAVKGLGGYHLAVDAADADAVDRLRRRKARDDKPFAVMVPSLRSAGELVDLDPIAADCLASNRAPVVVAGRRAAAGVADAVAPGLTELGVMLPYTPLHHLLLADTDRPLVMTSGNVSDEPIAHDDADAIARLGSIADVILAHDRAIHVRSDDSVVRVTGRPGARGRVQTIRRSRGHAPEPISLPVETSVAILAVGAELKNTVAVTTGAEVVASHHIGDLSHLPAYTSFLQAVEHLPRLHGIEPALIAHDLHPDYLSTKWAEDTGLPLVGVQHHHAHVAACLVEHGQTGPVLGVAFDGLGYGPDGTIWGGELLDADLRGFTRVGHLEAVPMPGGAAAVREPWRMAVTWLDRLGATEDLPSSLDPRWPSVLALSRRDDTLWTSSAGRLFDAVGALLGVRATVSYEGQAAIELEALARHGDPSALRGPAELLRADGVVELAPLMAAVLAARRESTPPADIAAGFHRLLADATVEAATRLAGARGRDTVVLTGGVFQNALLTERITTGLRRAGLDVLVHASIPPNDGGISIGQAAVAAARHPAASPATS